MRNTENKGQKRGRFAASFLTDCLFSGVFSFIMHVLHLSCMCSSTWRQGRESELSFHNPIDFHTASPSQQEINCILDSFQRELQRQVLGLLRALLTLGNPGRWGCVLMDFLVLSWPCEP